MWASSLPCVLENNDNHNLIMNPIDDQAVLPRSTLRKKYIGKAPPYQILRKIPSSSHVGTPVIHNRFIEANSKIP